jgi:hypothetical protein
VKVEPVVKPTLVIDAGNYSGTINEPSDLDFDIWGYLIANA